MTFLSQGLEYKKDLTDPKNTGILIPHNKAEGRTTLDGKTLRASSSDKLVRVKSIAVSDKKFVCPEHLSKVHFPAETLQPAWGLRAVSSLVEGMTQQGLSLKHSGSFVQVPKANQLYSIDTGGKVTLNSSEGTVEVKDSDGNVISTYPLPNKFDIIHPEVKKGGYIGTTLATASAGLGLDVMIKIMNARKAMPDEGLAKNVITLSNCFAPLDGTIKYDYEKGIYFIGDQLMGDIDKTAVYYFPNGHKVKKYDRIHSHPLNPRWYLKNNFPLEDVYFMFRKEFKSLAGNDTTEELLETLFHLLIKKDFKTGSHEYLGASRGITKGNESFFAQLSFEKGKSAISRLAAGELKFENDIFTRNILDHLIISAKSKKITITRALSTKSFRV